MTREAAQKALQQMHATRTVTNKAVVAWHLLSADQVRQSRPNFPSLNPSVSPVDLLLAAGHWMEMTEQGQCDPAFPFDYQSALVLPDPEGPQPGARWPWTLWLGLILMAAFGVPPMLIFHQRVPALELLSLIGSWMVLLSLLRPRPVLAIQNIRAGAALHALAMRVIDWSVRHKAGSAGVDLTVNRGAPMLGLPDDRRLAEEAPPTAVAPVVQFSGQLTDAVRDDCRTLYSRWDPFYPDPPLPRSPSLRRLFTAASVILLLVLAAMLVRGGLSVPNIATVLFLVVIVILRGCWPKYYWRRWWNSVQTGAGEAGFSGEITRQNARWLMNGAVFSWSDFIEARISDQAMLLYLTKADALPLHQSMFRTQEDWQRVIGWIQEAGVPVRQLGKRGRS